jgi:transglutaminase-like putative cysteine protease
MPKIFMSLRFFTLLFWLTIWSWVLTGQNIADIRAKYPGQHELILKDKQTYRFSLSNDKPKIISDNYFESLILSEAGIQNTSESFSFSELVPLKSFDAYTVINTKGKEKKIPINPTTEKTAESNSVFYSDVREKKLTFNNLEIGAKKVYAYQSEFLDPYLLHRFMFANNLPVNEAELEVITDNDIKIGYKIFNDPNNEIKLIVSEARNKTTYNWKRVENKPIKYEQNHPGYLHVAPHIVLYIKQYKSGKNITNVLGDTELLYKYYKIFTESINKTEDPELKEIALNITTSLESDKEKIKAIFYWVKDNIKYVAFENGYEGFIPRDAKLVNARRFGDCKDMSSIITQMAKYAKIPNVNLCWIGTRRIPYSYHEIATPAVDDHMIASIDLDGKIIFLDATDKEAVFGLPTGFIQGKDAMIQRGDEFEIVKVPVVTPMENLRKESIQLTLDKSTLKGVGNLSLHGIYRSDFLNNIGDAAKNNRLEIIKSLVIKGNNKFQLKEYKEQNVENRDLPYIVDYQFNLENYVVSAANEYYLSMFLSKPFEQNVINKDREAKYEFDFLYQKDFSVSMKLPPGMKVKKLPEDISADNALMAYNVKYRLEDNLLKLDFMVENKKLLLEPSDFELWNTNMQNLKSIYNENIVLTE